jgi:glutathione synthase/RimK-type ligase-like ATP-grasp enzyme
MKDIVILTDYKGFFGSKQKSPVYRGGMDISSLSDQFSQEGYNVHVVNLCSIDVDKLKQINPAILYTSSEDSHGDYKSFVEDIIFNFEQRGFLILPSFAHLKAHNNKVAMELLRDRSGLDSIKTIHSMTFGTLEELISSSENISFPVVIKPASGAMSKGVSKAETIDEMIAKAKKISRSFNLRHDTKELLRKLKYRSTYKKESFFRSKFIIQNFIPGLENDWKILVYGNKCYVLYRGNRKNDFRASGSGNFVFREDLPVGLLDYAFSIKEHFNVPHISLDIGFDGRLFHLIEFQFLYFGTTTLEKSPFYFSKTSNEWVLVEKTSILEEVYTHSIVDFLNNQNQLQ